MANKIKRAQLTRHFMLDVEADGQIPAEYNMISFGIVSIATPSLSFLGEIAPIVQSPGIAEARAVSGISYETQLTYQPAVKVMAACSDWLNTICKDKRPIFWSDNPGFDWSFFNYYMHRFYGENPAGHSIRRLGDFYAGTKLDVLNTSGWKKLRQTVHDHNPVNDARGNAEALLALLERHDLISET